MVLFSNGLLRPIRYSTKIAIFRCRWCNSVGDLVADTVGDSRVGDLIELGFFDLDTNDADNVYTPNTDQMICFTELGLLSLVKPRLVNKIPVTAVGAGYFGFETIFSDHDSYNDGYDNVANTNSFTSGSSYIID